MTRLSCKLDELPDEEEMYDLAELFKVFGDSTRIRILFVLLQAERKCYYYVIQEGGIGEGTGKTFGAENASGMWHLLERRCGFERYRKN